MWKFTSPFRPVTKSLAPLWKALALRLFRERAMLRHQNLRQKRLLVWILNQLVQEQSAASELGAWDTHDRPNSKGGQA